jgi:hypothetical protein
MMNLYLYQLNLEETSPVQPEKEYTPHSGYMDADTYWL